jgi:hypothetical protein
MKIAEGVKVLSFFPGRVRLRVDALKGNRVLAEAVEMRLKSIPGIARVETNATSASLLVRYDRRRIAQRDAAQALGAALRELFPQLDFSRLEGFLIST